jgi:hypothetical protein
VAPAPTISAAIRAGDAAAAVRGSSEPATIVLVAGRMAMSGRVGHHDYVAGCAMLAAVLGQSAGVRAIAVRDGWPEDEGVFESAQSIVCYSGGGSKHEFFASAQRIERIQRLVDRGVGLVMIHQAVGCPVELAGVLSSWIGGAHIPAESARGHWRTHHRELPEHPVTRGVQPWKIRDGWLREIRFVEGMIGVTPLVWSSRKHRGSSAGGAADVVAWTYDRPNGGRSFCFTGVDAHAAWSVPAVRQLMINGILWSAGRPIPGAGAPCAVDEQKLQAYLTPRRPRGMVRTLLDRLQGLARPLWPAR